MKYFVVQPFGRDKGRAATVVYEANTVAEAFAEIDRLAEQMARTGAAPDTIELMVVDENRQIIRRTSN